MQQERFVHEYLATSPLNATLAYQRAGYKATGQAARTAAARLLKQPAIQAAIAALRAKDAAKFEVTRERVIEEYAKLAFFDPRKFYNEDGSLKLPTELADAEAAALVSFKVDEEYDAPPPDQELEGQPHGGALKRQRAKTVAVGRTVEVRYSKKREALDSLVNLMGWKKEEKPLGTAENPLTMVVKEMQGRKSALTPVVDTDRDE
ncbi:terminase small subunit [Sphingobium cupriresistens]|uniref:terminase small subunit n=1 Tax=Sphingobium cupriresistens TaxID=1132417 RepID=UPI003BF53417